MSAVRDKGVNFRNSHSLFPTFTMANASGMASGHYLGDTGVFSNSIYTGHPPPVQNNSRSASSNTTRCWATSTSSSMATTSMRRRC